MKPDIFYSLQPHEKAIQMIKEYMDESLFEPGKKWPTAEFELRTYSRWITNEILDAVRIRKNTPPLVIIEEIVEKMDRFSYMTEDTEQSLLFAIAKDTAEDISRLFL